MKTDLELLDEFTSALVKADMSPRTISGYRHDLESFLRWLGQERSSEELFRSLEPIDLIHYRHHMVHTDGHKPATVNRRLQALRRFCRWAKQKELLEADPSQEIKTMRTSSSHRPHGLKIQEVYALLRTAGMSTHGLARRNLALIHVSLQAGLRVSELVALTVGDATVRARSGFVVIRDGKGHKARQIPLNAAARKALRAYLDMRVDLDADSPLFVTKRGTAMSVRAIQKVVSETARRAKVDRIQVSPHTLRHTFALNYLKQNPGKLVELANLMGHESLDTTAMYTQPSTEELARDLERTPLNIHE